MNSGWKRGIGSDSWIGSDSSAGLYTRDHVSAGMSSTKRTSFLRWALTNPLVAVTALSWRAA
jgi:hypothetical protein